MKNSKKDYSDMLGLLHHVSKTHPQMSVEKRAAQFSPFAALTGYENAVEERARLTEERLELDENRVAELEWDLQALQERLRGGKPVAVSITYFEPDSKKDGGAYVTVKGEVKKIDRDMRRIVLADGQEVKLERIYGIMLDETEG